MVQTVNFTRKCMNTKGKNMLKLLVNQIKVLLLNFFTIINEPAIAKYELQTNDYLIGVAYTSMMDSLTVAYGLGAIKYNNVTVEALIHPCRYEDGTIDNHFDEYLQIR